MPVGLSIKAGNILAAKSEAMSSNSPSYHSGLMLPNGWAGSSMSRCADIKPPNTLGENAERCLPNKIICRIQYGKDLFLNLKFLIMNEKIHKLAFYLFI